MALVDAFEATLQEDDANALSSPLVLRWFNLHYVQKMIATGQRLVVFGKPRLRGQRIVIPGFRNKLSSAVAKRLPATWTAKIVRKINGG